MIVSHESKIDYIQMIADNVKGAGMKKLVGPDEGWESHVMRQVNLEPRGYSPKHQHDWPHINYVLNGEGIIHIDGVDHPVTQGSYAYIPAGKMHQFVNLTDEEMKFICIVPKEGHL
ncbi:MAG: cupin domain-containing protein [Clostridiales bacterium]|nr:cupin domain-containing protein [Clostridiales bacterium]